jgi:hypothetical protein
MAIIQEKEARVLGARISRSSAFINPSGKVAASGSWLKIGSCSSGTAAQDGAEEAKLEIVFMGMSFVFGDED